MAAYILWLIRILIQPLVFFIWSLELEIETLFLDGTKRGFFRRLSTFPNKLGVRCIFLILGGYHASRLQLLARDCEKTQDEVLKRILRQARQTAYGRDHEFTTLESYKDYIARIPIQSYTEHQPYIERQMNGEKNSIVPGQPLRYATTSGTTGQPKYIPVTRKASRLSQRNISLIWLYYLARRNIGFLNDSILAITGSSVEGVTPDGTPFGSASGQLRDSLPRFMKRVYAIPEEVFQIENYEARYYCLALFSLKSMISHITSANPSTLVLLFETIENRQDELINDIRNGSISSAISLSKQERSSLSTFTHVDPERAIELSDAVKVAGCMDPTYYWPNLASVGCWKGGNSPLFLERLRRMIPDAVPIFDLGYLASEIRATVPVERLHHGGIPTFHRNFFEFVPVETWTKGDKTALRLHELELGESYYVIITTDCGLYRYHINDIVRVVSFFAKTPELVFEQKGEGVTNLTGEKLYEQQVHLAMAAVALNLGLCLRFYLCLLNSEHSRYEFLIEHSNGKVFSERQARDFLLHIDEEMGEVNMEYKAKRKSLRLAQPRLHCLADGAFASYRNARVQAGVRESQFKMVLLSSKIEMLKDFEVVKTFDL